MVEKIYNILKEGKTISCDDLSKEIGASKDTILAVLNYLIEIKLIKKEFLNTSASCNLDKCTKCKTCNKNFNPIYVYTLNNN